MARTRDMTRGSPTGHIILFALPLMLGNIFQQLYTATDAAIVGQFAGVEALGAVGSADWPMWLWMSVIVGFMQGFSILLAQRFGARDTVGLRRAAAMAILLGAGIALFLRRRDFLRCGPCSGSWARSPGFLKWRRTIYTSSLPASA